jgi:hypothetical protein
MKASEVLRAGLAKLDGGKAWTQRGTARKRNNQFTFAGDPQAVKWCSLGAISMPGFDVDTWNDAPERTYADVEAAFQKAIALAEAEGN